MDPILNPFTPGAGTRPPALAGRESIIDEATISIKRAIIGNHCRSQMLLGLRGVGKTVLLNQLEDIANANNHIVTFIEADEQISLVDVLSTQIPQVLKKLSNIELVKQKVQKGFSVFKSFISTFEITYADVTVVNGSLNLTPLGIHSAIRI